MNRRLLGPVGGPILFFLVAGLVFAGLGWVTVASLRVEQAQRDAAAQADLGNNLRVALWRLDGRMLPALGVEDSRPYHHYTAYSSRDAAREYGPACAPLLAAPLPDWMQLHFEVDPADGWRSPQVLKPHAAAELGLFWPSLPLRNANPDRAALLDLLGKKYATGHVIDVFAARERAIPSGSPPLAGAQFTDGYVPPADDAPGEPVVVPHPADSLPKPAPPAEFRNDLPRITAPPVQDASDEAQRQQDKRKFTAPTGDETKGPESAESLKDVVGPPLPPAPAPRPAPAAEKAALAKAIPGNYGRSLDNARNEYDARLQAVQRGVTDAKNAAVFPYYSSNSSGNGQADAGPAANAMKAQQAKPAAGPATPAVVGGFALGAPSSPGVAPTGPIAAAPGFGGKAAHADRVAATGRDGTPEGGTAGPAKGGAEADKRAKDGAARDPLPAAGVAPAALAAADPKALSALSGAAKKRAMEELSWEWFKPTDEQAKESERFRRSSGGLLKADLLREKDDKKEQRIGEDATASVPPVRPAGGGAGAGPGVPPAPGGKPAPPAPTPVTPPVVAVPLPVVTPSQPDPAPPALLEPAAPAAPRPEPSAAAPVVVPDAAASVAVHLGSMRPQWLTADGTDTLVLVRTAKLDNKTVYQGVVLDWARLQAVLKDEVGDLFPDAKLVPVKDPSGVSPERAMTALPVQLDPGPAPAPAPTGWTPLRFGLVLAWAAALIAFAAVGLCGWSLIDLAERRIRFVSAVTHELRTPLTSLRLYLDLLLSGMVQDEGKRQEYLSTLNAESDRLHRLIDNVLDFARLERRRKGGRTTAVTVADLLGQLRQTWTDRCGTDGKELVVISTLPPDAEVRTDPALLQQVVGNLIDNARKYSREATDARIWVWAKPDGPKRVLFEVEDRGPGVPARERSLIFRPFRRGETADTTAGGAGLGLALSKQWAEMLGGKLTYRPADGGTGACFRLELPAK